jgi:hypothetical protein
MSFPRTVSGLIVTDDDNDTTPPPHRPQPVQAMAPVILRMDVHCYGCAGKIRRVVKKLLGTYYTRAPPRPAAIPCMLRSILLIVLAA